MLGASGEVCMGLNQGRIPSDSHWRIPGPPWSHSCNYGMEPGEESSELLCSRACLVASEQVAGGIGDRSCAMLPWNDWFADWRSVDRGLTP